MKLKKMESKIRLEMAKIGIKKCYQTSKNGTMNFLIGNFIERHFPFLTKNE